MKKYTCDDRFTPEGIPITSPYGYGMPGSDKWMYDTCCMECEHHKREKETPAMAYSDFKNE